jgi:hypothetical protein
MKATYRCIIFIIYIKKMENTKMESDQTWKPFQLAEIPTLILYYLLIRSSWPERGMI